MDEIRLKDDGSMATRPSVFRRVQSTSPKPEQPAIFGIVEVSKKWYAALPADLRRIVDEATAIKATGNNPQAIGINERVRKAWIEAAVN